MRALKSCITDSLNEIIHAIKGQLPTCTTRQKKFDIGDVINFARTVHAELDDPLLKYLDNIHVILTSSKSKNWKYIYNENQLFISPNLLRHQ